MKPYKSFLIPEQKKKTLAGKKKKSMKESVPMTGRWDTDSGKWFDGLSDASEQYFSHGKNVPMFKELIQFCDKIRDNKFKPTVDKLNVLKALANALPNRDEYKALKSFMDNLTPATYKREFKNFEGGGGGKVSVISSIFNLLVQAVYYYENEGEEGSSTLEAFKESFPDIDEKYIPAIFEMLKENNWNLDDIKSVEEGKWGNAGVYVEVGNEEWLFVTDEEADDLAREDIKNLLDDIGVTGLNNVNLEDYVDTDWFADALREMEEFYVEDISNESDRKFENRLVQEAYDAGVITDDDFEKDEDGDPDYNTFTGDEDKMKEDYIEYLIENAGDPIQYYIDNFGKDEFDQVVIKNNLVDLDALTEYILDVDGRANSLARYDGYEHEVNDIYYYRQN